MTRPLRTPGQSSLAHWLAQPDDRRLELVDGEFVEEAAPTLEHGRAQTRTGALVGQAFDGRVGGPGGPGGWWITTDRHTAPLDSRPPWAHADRVPAPARRTISRRPARRGARARAGRPFEALEVQVAELLGDDP